MTQKRTIGRYEILERIGRGMQGTVFLARDPVLDRSIAIKLLHGSDPIDQERADQDPPLEARISSRLRHPNIVPIYDIGMEHGIPYLVFEYVQGQTLRQLLSAHGKLALERVCELALPILDAMAHAHSEGVIHLDLSPRNVLIDAKGNPRVMDFGLSQFAHKEREDSDEVRGSLLYMAPEHFTREPLGTFTDVYALGAMFYQLATGTTTVDGETVEEVARKIVSDPANLSALPEGSAGDAFAAFLRGSQQKDVRMRYRDGGEMREALKQFVTQNKIELRSDNGAPRTHSTVQFLLRRMQRKEDFPSISRVLIDINRLTNQSNSASADKLANIILRDYALTNKILKIVNSAFYARAGGEVTSISRAIVVLGFDRVRATANSLAYFSKLQGSGTSALLRDSMIMSFLSGLIARHLAQRARLRDAEEAFICGLFQNLGENLAIYYFPEDHLEIKELVDAELEDKVVASQRVLGVNFAEIGVEVAKIWHLPESIIAAIRAPIADDSESPHGAITQRAAFANELCALVSLKATEGQDAALDRLLVRYGIALELSREYIFKLFAAGLDKLEQNAQILDFDCAQSPFCHAARAWLERVAPEAAAEAEAPESGRAAG